MFSRWWQGLGTSSLSIPDLEGKTFPDDLSFPALLNGDVFDKSVLKGKVVIVTNTASKCGLTDNHYKQLAELDSKYREKGLEILGFPCAQFMNQEHTDVCSIKDRADNAKVKFRLFEKVDVNGDKTHEVFQWCKKHTPEFCKNEKKGTVNNIGWNFGKFLINRQGHVVAYFGPKVDPVNMETQIVNLLELN